MVVSAAEVREYSFFLFYSVVVVTASLDLACRAKCQSPEPTNFGARRAAVFQLDSLFMKRDFLDSATRGN